MALQGGRRGTGVPAGVPAEPENKKESTMLNSYKPEHQDI